MNWDTIQGDWKTFKGKVRQKWGKLTDDDLERIAGKKDELVGRLQKAYGIGREEAERQVEEFGTGFEDTRHRPRHRPT